jgi:hypothetical protein
VVPRLLRTRTRSYTNPNGTEDNAAGRSVRACVAREYLAVVPRPLPRYASQYLITMPRAMPAAPRRYLIVVPRPLPAMPLVVSLSYFILLPRPIPAAPRSHLIVAQSVARGAARCAPQVLDLCAHTAARGAARCAAAPQRHLMSVPSRSSRRRSLCAAVN